MKVAYIVDSGEGAAWTLQQLRALRDEYGCDVTACLSSERGGLVDALRAEGIPVRVWGRSTRTSTGVMGAVGIVVELARLFRRERFDVVQMQLFRSMLLGRMASWLADVPVRLTMVTGPKYLETYSLRWLDRATCWMETATIASCEYTRTLLRRLRVPEARLELIYYGTDHRRFDPERTRGAGLREQHGWPADVPLLGMVAYFYPPMRLTGLTPPAVYGRGHKGHDDLIRAMPLVLEQFPAAKLLLIGGPFTDGGMAYFHEMQALVARLGLSDSVRFTGFRADVPACLVDLDVSIQPSLTENLGGTIEALMMACPVVATRVGGMVDSIRDGQTGVLVNPADPADLARGIVRLLGDPEGARRLGRAGRALMLDRFTLTRTVRDLHELYVRRLPRRPAARRGYRLHVSIRRACVLIPVATYLKARLTVEKLAFHLYDRWRARPSPPLP